MGLRILRSEFSRTPQQRQRLVQRVLVPAHDSEMKVDSGRSWLDPQGLGKLRRGFVQLGGARQHSTEVVMKVRTRWIEPNGLLQLGESGAQFGLEAQCAAEAAVGLGILRRKFYGGPRLAHRAFVIALRGECIGEVDVCRNKGGSEFHRGSELRDRLVDVAGGKQHPAQGVMAPRKAGRNPDQFLERGSSRGKISSLDRPRSFLVEILDS